MGEFSRRKSAEQEGPRRSIMPKACWSVAIILAMAVLTPGLAVAQLEVPTDQRVQDLLPADVVTGPHYRIRTPVVMSGFMHIYAVDSDFGVFQATGDIALRKLLNEISAIAGLREVETSDAVGASLKYTAGAPLRFGKSLVTSPVDTVSGIGHGIGRIFGNVAEALTEEHDPSEDSRLKQLLQVSAWKRNFASQFKIDVYTSNEVLQDELDRVGWASALAGLAVSAVLLPVSGPAVAGFKVSRMADQIENVLTEEPPSRLRIINEDKMRGMGIGDELIEAFLDHPSFTPRHDTVIVEALSRLTRAQGRANFFLAALEATEETSANFYQHMAEILLGYDSDVSAVVEIANNGGLLLARVENGSVLIPMPVDSGIWTLGVEGAVDRLRNLQPQPTAGATHELWMTGEASNVLREQLRTRGIRLTENVDTQIGFMD